MVDPIARLDLPAARAHLVERLRTDDLTGAQRSLQRIVELDVDPLAHPDMKRAVLDLLTKVAVLPGAASDQLFQMVSTRMGEPGLDLLLEVVATRGGSVAAGYATRLLERPDVLSRGSPALRVAWAVRLAKGCDEVRELLPQATRSGDDRVATLLRTIARCRTSEPCCPEDEQAITATVDAIGARIGATAPLPTTIRMPTGGPTGKTPK